MLKRNAGGLLLTTMLLAGCATTGARNNQTEMDAMNARLAALEGQLSQKDQELRSLEGQMSSERAAREAAEADRQRMAMQLESAKTESRTAKAPASDLK